MPAGSERGIGSQIEDKHVPHDLRRNGGMKQVMM
jgi:hypothetical protein